MQKLIDNKYEKLREFFTTTTRNIRRNLLVSSSILLMLVIVNPTKITGFLGFTLDENTPHYIPIGGLSIVVMYELVAFILYAINDYQAWKLKPYEKTYLFTENKLSEISENINKTSQNINMRKADGLEHIDIPDVKCNIEQVYLPSLINSARYSADGFVEQYDAELGTIVTKSKEISELENLFRKDAEEKIKEHLSILFDEKENELNSLVKSENEKYVNDINKMISVAENTINLSTDSYESSSYIIQKLVKEVEGEIENYRNGISQFNFFHKSKIFIIDLGIPLTVGILSIGYASQEIVLFLKYIVSI